MPRIGSVSPKAVAATIDLGGESSIALVYKPHAIVTAEKAIADAADQNGDSQETRNVLAHQLAGLLVSWDATGPLPDEDLTGFSTAKAGEIVGEDQVIPLDPATLSWLSVPVLKGLIMAIVEHSGEYPKGTPNGSLPPGVIPMSTRSN